MKKEVGVDERVLEKVAERIVGDEIKLAILLTLDDIGLAEMSEVYKRIVKEGIEDVTYSKFYVRIRTLTDSGLIKKVRAKGMGIGNVVFLELTEKGKKIVEIIRNRF